METERPIGQAYDVEAHLSREEQAFIEKCDEYATRLVARHGELDDALQMVMEESMTFAPVKDGVTEGLFSSTEYHRQLGLARIGIALGDRQFRRGNRDAAYRFYFWAGELYDEIGNTLEGRILVIGRINEINDRPR